MRNKEHENDDISEFEAELRKLRPASGSAGILPAMKQARNLRSQRQARSLRTWKIFTHTVGILLGMLLGGGLVHFLHKPVVVVQVVEIVTEKEAVPEAKPSPVPVEKPMERRYAQMPLDIDGMIEQYNKRSKLLASLPPSRFSSSYSPIPPGSSDDPNSLLLLRESMKM